MFSEGLSRAMGSVGANAGLIRKVAFPHDVVVHASVAATFVVNLAGYVAVLIVLKAFGEHIHFAGLVLALIVWAVLFVAITGLAMAFAALQVFVKDVEYVLMPVLAILMYLTPILYPLTLVPETVRPWVAANPFGWVVNRLRDMLLDGSFALVPGDAIAVIVAFAIFVAGRWFFRRLSPSFEDFL
jgi:ABC-type polysaccharide/polyol phosphate export permease